MKKKIKGFTTSEMETEAMAIKQVNYQSHHIKHKMRILGYAAIVHSRIYN